MAKKKTVAPKKAPAKPVKKAAAKKKSSGLKPMVYPWVTRRMDYHGVDVVGPILKIFLVSDKDEFEAIEIRLDDDDEAMTVAAAAEAVALNIQQADEQDD